MEADRRAELSRVTCLPTCSESARNIAPLLRRFSDRQLIAAEFRARLHSHVPFREQWSAEAVYRCFIGQLFRFQRVTSGVRRTMARM